MMRRRAFIAGLGGAAAWPMVARAQRRTPIIGFLGPTSPGVFTEPLRAFREGLRETGYIEGDNATIIYRFADPNGRLPELADDLVRREASVIATFAQGVFAAKAATTTIPVVFVVADDPVRLGLVTSLARPDGNLTGINFLNAELSAKRLDLLRELIPAAHRIAVLVGPAGSARELEAAYPAGLEIQSVNALTSQEIDEAFKTFANKRPEGLFVSPDPFFRCRRVQLTHLATRHAIPATYALREYCEAGGLMSYGASQPEAFRQLGLYTGKILNGAKPVDLPIVQASKFELVINAQAARIIGLDVPPSLLARADEVIE